MLLITGAGGGLGKYCFAHLGGVGLTRDNATSLLPRLAREGVDAIVHCAFSRVEDPSPLSMTAFLEDTMVLTERLSVIPHQVFILVSCTDVYPPDGGMQTEDREIPTQAVPTVVGRTKLMCETIVHGRSPCPVILRVSSLLGVGSRPSPLMTLRLEENPTLPLAPDAVLNCVRHQDVLACIRGALHDRTSGTFNVAASENITLARAAELLEKTPRYGSRKLDIGTLHNARALRWAPELEYGSEGLLRRFIQDQG